VFEHKLITTQGEIRLEIHMESASGNVDTSVTRSRDFVLQMIWLRSSLDIIEEILISLQSQVRACGIPRDDNLGVNYNMEFTAMRSNVWANNLIRLLKFVRGRINDLAERQRATQEMVRLSFLMTDM